MAQDDRELFLSNVVVFSVQNAKREEIKAGYGLILGRQDKVLWVATAAHVLFPPGAANLRSPSPLGTVTARWLSSDVSHGIGGRVLFPLGLKDVVFVPIDAPISQAFLDTWLRSVLAHVPKPGERLWLAGSGRTIAIEGDGFAIPPVATSASASGSSDHTGISAVHGQEGQSGSPIITTRGMVGLYLGLLDTGQGEVVSIASLMESARKLNVPWQLGYNDAPDSTPARFCIVHTGPERPAVRLVHSELLTPDIAGCIEALRTTYRVDTQDSHILCEPENLDLSTSTAKSIGLDCRVSIVGIWPTGTLGGAQFSALGWERWKFAGLANSPHGSVSGDVQGRPPDLLIKGQTSTHHDFFGSLKAEKGRIRGQLTIDDGELVTFELERP